jgi:CHASE1-domain containing sensor protein
MLTLNPRSLPGRKYPALLRSPVPASLLVLAAGLLITWWMWQNEKQNAMQKMQKQFDFRVIEFEKFAAIRLHEYEQVLQGMGGLFAASRNVERNEFRNYANALKLEKSFPGAQGVYFSVIVPPAQIDQHIAAVRKEGFPDYAIKPESKRDFYTATIFLEPFERNQQAFGYDNFTDAIHLAAMEQARDSGGLSFSGKLTQERGSDPDQSDFRMYAPIYRKGSSTQSVDERRNNILGWLYMPIRMVDLMGGALGEDAGLDVEIYDSTDINAGGLCMTRIPAAPTLLFNLMHYSRRSTP